MACNKGTIVILCGGGPAPGINTVISTVAKLFLNDGYKVIGLHNGYEGLFSEKRQIIEFDFEIADKIFNTGGSILYMSRFKPKGQDLNIDFFTEFDIRLLVTIGGDDTASTANRLTKLLKTQNIIISNIHVPKTIDNDLPLPDRNPTFGFHSAKDQGVKIGNIIAEDARTNQSWFVLSAMGRSAGHLALGIGASCHFPMIIIPEMFKDTKPTFDKIINLIISSILKRKILGINYGAVIISEGVFHILDEEEINGADIAFTYDTHGHPELGNISKSNIFNILLQRKLRKLELDVKTRPNDLGYELRCCRPIGFDLTLCSILASGVMKLFSEGISGCIVTADSKGDITPLFLDELQNSEGVIPPRLVEIETDFAKLCFQNLHFVTKTDLDEAKEFVATPQSYLLEDILELDLLS